jgi:hypothetical protein
MNQLMLFNIFVVIEELMIKGDYITCDGSDSQEEVNDSLFEMKY